MEQYSHTVGVCVPHQVKLYGGSSRELVEREELGSHVIKPQHADTSSKHEMKGTDTRISHGTFSSGHNIVLK